MAEKILIVDDDVDTLRLVGLMLERQNYEIAVASTGEQGLAKASAELPDLILMDVMMPDMDGYEATRRIRSDPNLAHIPIIMFTAKSMVDDKVAGFEAGVDDYLTKPTHPVELTAHVKAVLARAQQAKPPGRDHAKVVSFLGARGGLGTSTLALNVAMTLKNEDNTIILAELNPGRGSMALDLKIPSPEGLSELLASDVKEINLRSVDAKLLDHSTGIRMLLSSHNPKETVLAQAAPQMTAVVNNLVALSKIVLLDLGAGFNPYVVPLAKLSDLVILVIDPVRPSDVFGKALIDELVANGVSRTKVHVALVSRMRTSLQIPWQQLADSLGVEMAGIISPAPEQAPQASHSGQPLVAIHPESLVSDQIRTLAEHLNHDLDFIPGQSGSVSGGS